MIMQFSTALRSDFARPASADSKQISNGWWGVTFIVFVNCSV